MSQVGGHSNGETGNRKFVDRVLHKPPVNDLHKIHLPSFEKPPEIPDGVWGKSLVSFKSMLWHSHSDPVLSPPNSFPLSLSLKFFTALLRFIWIVSTRLRRVRTSKKKLDLPSWTDILENESKKWEWFLLKCEVDGSKFCPLPLTKFPRLFYTTGSSEVTSKKGRLYTFLFTVIEGRPTYNLLKWRSLVCPSRQYPVVYRVYYITKYLKCPYVTSLK